MEMIFNEQLAWLFFAYASGSVVTAFLMWKSKYLDVISTTIDSLVENGFLRYKRKPDGEIEILKWDAKDE